MQRERAVSQILLFADSDNQSRKIGLESGVSIASGVVAVIGLGIALWLCFRQDKCLARKYCGCCPDFDGKEDKQQSSNPSKNESNEAAVNDSLHSNADV